MKGFLVLFYLLVFHLCMGQQLRVEPPNWWIGMEHDTIQLLVHGPNVGETTVRSHTQGLEIIEQAAAESQNYTFIDLVIREEAVPGDAILEIIPKVGQSKKIKFPLLIRENGSAERPGFDNSDAVYLIVPDRFANGDPKNDDMPGMIEKSNRKDEEGRHGGDLKGMENALPYIADLGFTAIWPTPLLENNRVQVSYHGYGITDFYTIDPRFGSNLDYKKYVQQANTNGLKIIQDFVLNHCGDNHWWMQDLPFANWINQWPSYTQTNHKKSVAIDPYVADIDQKTYLQGWFVPSMPDLNQENKFLAKYLIQNAIWWIEFSGIQGIRVDTYSYSDPQFMAQWNQAILKEYPNFSVVGEEWTMSKTVIARYQKGAQNPDGYEGFLTHIMDFPLLQKTLQALNEPNTWQSSWSGIYESLAHDYVYAHPQKQMIFLDNHDETRVFRALNHDFEHWKLAMTLLTSMRGFPQMLYGTEILMTHKDLGHHTQIRANFPGGWPGDSINAFTATNMSLQSLEAQSFLRKLLQFRKHSPALQYGKLLHYAPEMNDCYVYFRYDEERRIMVILNKNEKEVLLNLSHYNQGLNGAQSGYDIISETNVNLSSSLKVPGKTPMLIVLD